MNCIRGAFHDKFPGFSGSEFCRKLVRTKTQQGIDKVSKHNRFAVFLRALVFRTHQQKWRQLCFIIYPLLVLLPHNLRQLPFLTPPLPPPLPPPEHAATILDRMSIPPGVAFPSLHPLAAVVAPVRQPRTGTSRRCHVGRNRWRRRKPLLP